LTGHCQQAVSFQDTVEVSQFNGDSLPIQDEPEGRD
jgi:hypothetical protein